MSVDISKQMKVCNAFVEMYCICGIDYTIEVEVEVVILKYKATLTIDGVVSYSPVEVRFNEQ